MTTPVKKNSWKTHVILFVAVLIGVVVTQRPWSWSTVPCDERKIPMSEPEDLSKSKPEEEQTPWQKYQMRKRFGLEGPASPESMLFIDMFQSRKPQRNDELVDQTKPVE